MKGVLICGGLGTRLKPLTDVTNKSLLPVYDQPLIHYPLKVLLNAGISEIMNVTGPEHIDQLTGFLGSGSRMYCKFTYRVQDEPRGIAHALGMAEEFTAGHSICALLGDNIYFDQLAPSIRAFQGGGHIFVKQVDDPHRFGVVEMQNGQVVGIEEKPQQPRSNLAQTGCYIYDNDCFSIIRNLHPSPRGELEITDVSKAYLQQGRLTATVLQDEWVDAGTFESLHKAAILVRERKLAQHQEKISATVQTVQQSTPPPAPIQPSRPVQPIEPSRPIEPVQPPSTPMPSWIMQGPQ